MATNTIKEYGAKRLTTEYVTMEAPGFVAIVDSCGVSVRRFKRDNETGRWLVIDSLNMWIGSLETRADVNEFINEFVKGKANEAKVD